MDDREIMQMALDALNNFDKGNHGMRWQVPVIKALRARLAQPEPEPVAWMWDVYSGAGYTSRGIDFYPTNIPFAKHTPLYTAPPQREVYCGCGDEIVAGDGARCGTCVAVKYKEKEWVGLTDDELHALHYELKCAAMGATSTLGMYRILERALREKNT